MRKVLILIAIIFVLFVFTGGTATAYAEELPETPTETPTETPEDEEDYENWLIDTLTDLYGEQYQKYYDDIVEQWGSAKAYVQNLIDEGTISGITATAWDSFVELMDKYAVTWIPIFAVALLLVVTIFGKKAITKITELFTKMFKGNNENAKALIAVIDAQINQLGNNEKYADLKKRLEAAKKELDGDD